MSSDVVDVVEPPYVSKSFYDVLGAYVSSPLFVGQDRVMNDINLILAFPPEKVVDMLFSDDSFVSQLGLIRDSLGDTKFKGATYAIAGLLDKHYPSVVEIVASDDRHSAWYHTFVRLLYNRIVDTPDNEVSE